MIELALGFLIAGALGVRGPALIAAGLAVGVVFYGLSCLIWKSWACWWSRQPTTGSLR